jgi:hypothetical protein
VADDLALELVRFLGPGFDPSREREHGQSFSR